MRVTLLGGGSEVGASCAHVEIGGRRLLIDAGIRLKGRDRLPDLAQIQDLGGIEAILVTHAHADHIGALPLVHQHYPDVPLYATRPTIRLMEVMLRDAVKVMGQAAVLEGEIPLYDERLVESMLTGTRPVEPGEALTLFGGAVLVSWFPSGHILGACSLGLWGRGDASLLFSGDISVTPQRTVGGLRLPPGNRWDALVLESTYGGRAHANRQAEESRLVAAVAQVVAGGGRVLIPAFALGRAQEVLLILGAAMARGELPPVPVYVDGLVRAVCEAYSDLLPYLPPPLQRLARRTGSPFFRGREVRPVASAAERHTLLATAEPAVIVASSGMLTGGASAAYAAALASEPGSAIFLSGYQDAESPGAELLALAEQGGGVLRLGEQTVSLRCQVAKYGLSAHADAGELLAVARASGAQEVLLVHGDGEAREALAAQIRGANPYLLPNGETWTVQPPRTQVATPGIRGEGIGRGRELTAADLPELWQFARRVGPDRDWTAERLAQAWYGEPNEAQQEAVCAVLAEAGRWYFRRDPRRPFLLRPLPEAEVAAARAKEAAAQRAAALAGHLVFLPGGTAVRPALVLAARGEEVEVALWRGEGRVPAGQVLVAAGPWPGSPGPGAVAAFRQAVAAAAEMGVPPATWWETARQPRTAQELAEATCPEGTDPVTWWVCIAWALAALSLSGAVVASGEVPARFAAVGEPAAELPPRVPVDPVPQHQAHAMALAAFAELGIYRAGLDLERKVITVYLALPDARPQEVQRSAGRLALESGWQVRVHPFPHQERLLEEMQRVLPPGWTLVKNPSVHHHEKRVVVEVRPSVPVSPDQVQVVAQAFHQVTGWTLELKGATLSPLPGPVDVAQVQQAAQSSPMEQNAAMARIRGWAAGRGVTVYKVSLKQDHIGKFLEVMFITPQVGARYREELESLGEAIGWRVEPARTPRQEAVAEVVRAALRPEWGLFGEPRLFIWDAIAQVRLQKEPSPAEWEEACRKVQEQTGYTLKRR